MSLKNLFTVTHFFPSSPRNFELVLKCLYKFLYFVCVGDQNIDSKAHFALSYALTVLRKKVLTCTQKKLKMGAYFFGLKTHGTETLMIILQQLYVLSNRI